MLKEHFDSSVRVSLHIPRVYRPLPAGQAQNTALPVYRLLAEVFALPSPGGRRVFKDVCPFSLRPSMVIVPTTATRARRPFRVGTGKLCDSGGLWVDGAGHCGVQGSGDGGGGG